MPRCGRAENDDTNGARAAASIPMSPSLRFGVASVRAMQARLRSRHAQIVHVATQGPLGRAAVLAADGLGLPVTIDFRNHFQTYGRFYRLGWLEPLIGAIPAAACTSAPTALSCRPKRCASGWRDKATSGSR